VKDLQRMTDDELAGQLHAALAARAEGVDVPAGEIQAAVATARRSALNRPSRVSLAIIPALAVLVVAGALVVLGVGRGPGSISSAAPSIPATPSVPAAPSAIPVARDPTGIPETFDGQGVTIGLAAVVHANETTDASPFLIGGWFSDGSGNACAGGPGRDPSPLLSGCATVVGGDSPWGDYSFPGPQGQMYWDGHQLPSGQGPSIVRVHTHDPRAAACLPTDRTLCLATMVVDDVLWSGDSWTDGAPISVAQAVQRLNRLSIQEDLPQPNGTLVVARYLFATPAASPCPTPWPHEVFELHGDPRFGLVAIFPDAATRIATQAALNASAPGCAAEPRVMRPGPAMWFGTVNVLVLTFGSEVGPATQSVLVDPGSPSPVIPFPPATLDESYRVVDDAEAARLSGDIDTDPVTNPSGSDWYDAYVQDTYRRFAADALSYVIGQGRPPTTADMDSSQWALLQRAAVPGTARLYLVDHSQSTDSALAHETIVAFEERQPTLDSWGFIVVDPPGG
jgi:hypothetical protein